MNENDRSKEVGEIKEITGEMKGSRREWCVCKPTCRRFRVLLVVSNGIWEWDLGMGLHTSDCEDFNS